MSINAYISKMLLSLIQPIHASEKAVVSWAKLAHIWYSIELGQNSTQALEMEFFLNQPSSHFAWATRQPQPIELPDKI